MSRKISNGLDLQSQKIINVADPTSAQDVGTKNYIDNATRALSWHDSVTAASTANVSVSSAPASLDGVTGVSGDRWLLKNQTTASENGIYVFNGTGSALTRAADMAAAKVLQTGSAVSTEGGGSTQPNQVWHITTPGTGTWTVGTTSTTWSQLGGGSGVTSFNTRTGAVTLSKADVTGTVLAASDVGATAKFSANIGDGSTTAITVTHNLGTRDVEVTVYDATGFDEIFADVNHATTNTVIITFATAPTSNQYRVVVIG
jgi:hypothetical protein